MAANYTPEEAEAILTRASGRKADQIVSHDRLLEMAEELGISPDEVEAVIDEVRQTEQDKVLRKEFISERRATLWPHLIPYLLVNLFLIAINVMSGSHHFWALYPLMGWGIGLGTHAFAVLPTKGVAFESEFAQWKQQRERKTQRQTRKSSKKAQQAAQKELDQDVETVEPIPVPVPRPTVATTEEKPQVLQQRSGS